MIKKAVFLCFALAALLTGCSMDAVQLYADESAIAGQSDSHVMIGSFQTVEGSVFSARVEQFDGMRTVWSYDAKAAGEAEIGCLLSVTSGKAKLVLVAPDKTVQTLFEAEGEDSSAQTGEMTLVTVPLQPGKSRVKLVACDQAKLAVTLRSAQGQLQGLH